MKIATVVSIVILFTLTASLAKSAEGPEAAAESAAVEWLGLLDAKSYPQSWNEASTLFRERRISESRWKSTAVRRHGWLGVLKSRKLQSAAYELSVKGSPDGEYVIVHFLSVFASDINRVIETVVAKKDADGMWRVADYYIAPEGAAGCSTGSRVNCT
jgi:hypothetical protein